MANSAVSIRHHRYAFLWGIATASLLHAFLAMGLASVAHGGLRSSSTTVEVDLVAKPPEVALPPLPPSPPPLTSPPVSAPKFAPRPKVAARPRPMPNREVLPTSAPPKEDAKPVFGVTAESVVAGESGMAVATGNTLMTSDRTLAREAPQPLPAAPPPVAPPAFAPVDDQSIGTWPTVKFKATADYPEMAKRMGIGGSIRLKVGIDRHGNVKSVRVLGAQRDEYGMNEAAVKAMWKTTFNPARLPSGQPVDFILSYTVTFQPSPDR